MPTYEYACAACGHQFEAIQKITEDSLTDCPECGKSEAKRQISATAFHLKGGGWYKTDYASSISSGGEAGSVNAGSQNEKASKNSAESSSSSSAENSNQKKSDSGEGKSSPSADKKPSKPSSDSKVKKEKVAKS